MEIPAEAHEPHLWRLHRFVLSFVALGAFVLFLVERYASPAWKDVGLIVGGILIGFIALSVDELIQGRPERRRASEQSAKEREEARSLHEKERADDQVQITALRAENGELLARLSGVQETIRRETLLSQSQTNGAYHLGRMATALPTSQKPDQELVLILGLCDDVGLRFSKKELQILKSTPAERSQVSEMVLSKAQSLRPAALRCFFFLGNKTEWLLAQAERAPSTRAALEEFENVHANPLLQMDPVYAAVVDDLLKVLRPYRELIPDEARESLKQQVHNVLGGIPSLSFQRDQIHIQHAATEWFWIEDKGAPAAMCFIGDRYSIIARDANTFDVLQKNKDKPESSARITRNDTGWQCSAHSKASEQQPCPEIELVLYATHGGKPVTEARVVMVRS